ncbi:MAG: hypothetical protein MJ211_00745 [Bacteroidales bacterium]|nr:hypothetical protein [Bacteroidales bacterium]
MKRLFFFKMAFQFTVFFSMLVITSCEKNGVVGTSNDDPYYVTTNNIVDCYFTPKKLNIYVSEDKRIVGDWFASEYLGTENYIYKEQLDVEQKFTERYYFLDEIDVKKYVDLRNENYGKEILIDKNDIISPFKEYSIYFGDTLCKTDHTSGYYGFGDNPACVLPLIGVDVICDKDFDEKHPAGTLLNDIIKYGWTSNIYNCLHEVDENNNLRFYGKRDLELYSYDKFSLEPFSITSLPTNPLLMMGSKFYLKFDHEPTNSGTYQFTVKFIFGPDPITGETVDIAPATVSIDF